MKFTFVILHYNVIQETTKCVDSIKKRIKEPVSIVIVDNASPNGTGKDLLSLYKDDEFVIVLLNEKNLGFANGNNVGIQFAKNTLKSDFVVVLNNDTFLVQDDFLNVILAEWNYSRFAVMGPKVHTYTNVNQNPVPWIVSTKKQTDRIIRNNIYHLIRNYLYIDDLYCRFKEWIKSVIGFKRKEIRKKEANDNLRQENVKLHGCCYVFSPAFFDHFEGFDKRTFMYVEEDILYTQVRNKGLLTVYNPKLEIFHAEKAATKASTKNNRAKNIFYYREMIKSLKILRDVLTENGGCND